MILEAREVASLVGCRPTLIERSYPFSPFYRTLPTSSAVPPVVLYNVLVFHPRRVGFADDCGAHIRNRLRQFEARGDRGTGTACIMHKGLLVTDRYHAEPLHSVAQKPSGAATDASALRCVGFRNFGCVSNHRGRSGPYFYHEQEGRVLGHKRKTRAAAMLAGLSQKNVPFDSKLLEQGTVFFFLL